VLQVGFCRSFAWVANTICLCIGMLFKLKKSTNESDDFVKVFCEKLLWELNPNRVQSQEFDVCTKLSREIKKLQRRPLLFFLIKFISPFLLLFLGTRVGDNYNNNAINLLLPRALSS